MAILARGNLSERPMSLVFGSLARRGFTGELTIDAGGYHFRVGWQDGAVIAADSPHPADRACKLAITLGIISSTQAGECSQTLAASPWRDEIEVLREVAHLADDVVTRLTRRLVGARASRALSPVEGEFIVTDDVPVAPPIVPIDARWILFTGIRHHFTLERLADEVTSLAAAIRLRADHDLGGFGFGPNEEEVLARLQQGELSLAPLPPGLDPLAAHAVALVLIATGEAEIARPGVARAPRTAPAAGVAAARAPASGSGPTTTGPVPRTPGTSTMVSRTPTPHKVTMVTPATQPLRPPPAMISRTPTPLANQFVPTGTATGLPPAPPAGVELPATAGTPPLSAQETMMPRTTTGPLPSRTTTGPLPSRTTTGPLPSRTATGPEARTATGEARTATGEARTATGSQSPSRTGAIPRKRNPLADDAPAIRELIIERAAMLDGDADHYAMLGIDRAADANMVRAAYFELARLLHPDRLAALGIPDDDRAAQRVFARINDAFTVLSTVTRRAEYDALLDAGGARAVAEKEAKANAQVQAAVEAEERFRLGEMAMRRQQADIAVHEFQRAVELKPDEPDYLALLGWALYVAARDKVAAVSVARAHLTKALAMPKETALPFLYLGRIARMEGEDDDASRAFRRALEIAPTNSEAQAELRVVEARRRSRPSNRGGLFSRLGKKP